MDQALKAKMVEKLENGDFEVDDIPEYLKLFVDLGNKNEDVLDEVDGWSKTVVLSLAEGPEYWIRIGDNKFSTGLGRPADTNLVLKSKGQVMANILCGDQDPTAAYMSGALKIEGGVPDAVRMRGLIALVREELIG